MKQFPKSVSLFALLVSLLLGGCATVGPDYTPPELDLPPVWSQDPAQLPDHRGVTQWWTLFKDPLLDRLIQTARSQNHDLKTAMARVDEVGARLGMVRADQLPTVDLQGETTRNFNSENTRDQGSVETHHDIGIAAGWELDLFGRVRRSIEAARADYQASVEDRTDVMIRLYAQVSLSYLKIRTLQARLTYARNNINSQMELLHLTRSRNTHGLGSGLDLAQAQRLLARAQAEVPPLNIALARETNALALLMGQPPGGLVDQFPSLAAPSALDGHAIPLAPDSALVGVPTNLLRQRPDIRRAERELAGQTARIGVTKADLYPRLTLNGSFGYATADISDWLTAGSQRIGFGPAVKWNLFSRDRIYNRIKAQEAVTRQYFLKYEYTVLNALREVEDNLKKHHEDQVRLERLEKAVEAARRSVKLSTRLYKKGLVDFQPVLDAQRDQLDFEDQLAIAQGNVAANFVTLYRVMGGGWNPTQIQN
ncbi:MAG: efflux transporter outer membrane subunit [Desulfobacterales bacterium]|nr:efflux transporter outer membrane subunit [Desulfobacterales bacterium]